MPPFSLGMVGCGEACTCGAEPPCAGPCSFPCFAPFPIPLSTLTLAWDTILAGDTPGTGSISLTFDGVDRWSGSQTFNAPTFCLGPPDDIVMDFVFHCDFGFANLYATYTNCAGGASLAGNTTDPLASCDPYSIGWLPDFNDDTGMFGQFFTSLTVTGTQPEETDCCYVYITAYDCFGALVAGAGVAILDGMTPVASGTTNARGKVRLDIGTPGDYTVQVDGFADQVLSMTCSQEFDVTPPDCCIATFAVSDCLTLLPVPGALVEILSGGSPVASGTTDGDGTAVIEVAAGTYDVEVDGGGTRSLEIACGGEYFLTDEYPCCRIEIQVLDCDNNPLEGVDVGADSTPAATGTTDASGYVPLNVGSAGTYDVTVDHPDYPDPVPLAVECGNGEPYVLTPDPAVCEGVPCGTCSLPRADLTCAYVTTEADSNSVTLTWDGVTTWTSGCIVEVAERGENVRFRIFLLCEGDTMVLRVRKYGSPGCTGTTSDCESDNGDPTRLVFDSGASTCDPLFLRWTSTGTTCGALADLGNTSFTITE